jgi:tellurite resistance protein
MGEAIVLPAADRARLIAAVHAVVNEDPGRVARLRAGARQTVDQGGGDDARRFQALLELGYLVASADGFADDERVALAGLLEELTGAAVRQSDFDLHFRDLDLAVAMLGRRERLGRAAADLTDDAAGGGDAIAFGALVAIADGRIDPAELDVLEELGSYVAMPPDDVRAVVRDVARRVEAHLR